MSMWLQDIIVALLMRILKGFAEKFAKEQEDARDKADLDEQRGIRDSKNVEKYYAAKTRADKIRSMLGLHNRNNT